MRRCKVLIVEDEAIIAFALEDLLEEMGHSPAGVANDLEEAMSAIEQVQPDVVILDVNLRGRKSYPLAHWLKEREIRFVFATGYGDGDHPDGLDGVPTVTKPYSAGQLRSAFQQLGC